MDYPNIRKSADCPLCHKAKDIGLIICWPCYREHDAANSGLDYLIVETLEKKETYLKAQAEAACVCGVDRDGRAHSYGTCAARTHRGAEAQS